jgi:Sec-independent protein translocase protein TatA
VPPCPTVNSHSRPNCGECTAIRACRVAASEEEEEGDKSEEEEEEGDKSEEKEEEVSAEPTRARKRGLAERTQAGLGRWVTR